ncbi:hypothetical protein SynSYN20_03234 [Synechococcus sp. SYN20]|nr:hypothetical protein SynSYN20_03234 [Synechococcus sp. SYN20]
MARSPSSDLLELLLLSISAPLNPSSRAGFLSRLFYGVTRAAVRQ